MTAKIKLNAASGGGSISIQAPSSSSNNRVIDLPDIADGTLLTSQSSLDSTKLSPAISAGITHADMWRVTADFSRQTVSDIDANWARYTNQSGSLFGYIGSGMTESSGVFTFPATGIWKVSAFMNYHSRTGIMPSTELYIFGTEDNSSYVELTATFDCAVMGTGYYEWGHMRAETFIDCTNTSTHKVKFRAGASNNPAMYFSGSGGRLNYFQFIRMGDT